MVQAFVVDGRVYLATRSGRTNAAVEAETMLRGDTGQRWVRLAAVAVDAGYTPLFEFCSPALQPSVSEASLTLTALRHRLSGAYMPYARVAHLAARFGVPVVPSLGTWHPPPPELSINARGADATATAEHLHAVLATVRVVLGQAALRRPIEGCLLMLPSGLVLKVKAPSHYALHSIPASYVAAQNHELLDAGSADEDDNPLVFREQPPLLTSHSPLLADVHLAEAVHLLVACASDAAASPQSPQLRVGHWGQRPSRARVSAAATVVLQTAEGLRRPSRDASPHEVAEQTLADSLELALHVVRVHGAPATNLSGYPVTELHALLAEELGLLPKDAPRPPPEPSETRLAARAAGGMRQTQSWPVDLLAGCGGRSWVPKEPFAQDEKPMAPTRVPRSLAAPKQKHRTPPRPSVPAGAFDTPLLASMLASFSRGSAPRR